MAYDATKPPVLMVSSPGNPERGRQLWSFTTTDAATAVDTAGYFTNGQSLGMKKYDLVFVSDTDATVPSLTIHMVVSLSTANDSVDLSNSLVGATADSD